jgi:hypothetical protein
MSVNDNRSDAMHARMSESHRVVNHCPCDLAAEIRMIEGRHDPDHSLLINY